TADGTAAAGSDYEAASGTLTFAPGETSKGITVVVNGDTAVEPDETFTVNLSDPTNATISDAQGTGTITNDDAHGTLQFSAATYSVNEGDGTATITVTRTGGSSGAVAVQYGTVAGGTATADSDHQIATGTVSFADGETASKSFTVTVIDDSTYEGDETVNLALSDPAGGATLGSQSTAVLTIVDNDPQPSLSINDVTVFEPTLGIANAAFTVTLEDPPLDQNVTVNYATANGTATAGSDYQSASGTLTFNPGETTKTITVVVNSDQTTEPDETFAVNLTNPTNAAIADSQGVGTIAAPLAMQTVFTLNALDSGWYNGFGNYNDNPDIPDNDNYLCGRVSSTEFRNFFVFDLSNVKGTVRNATLRVLNPDLGYRSLDSSETYTIYDVSTAVSVLRTPATGRTDIFDDLGSGTTFGSVVIDKPASGASVIVSASLNGAALAALNSDRSLFALGGALTTVAGPNEFVFAGTGNLVIPDS
ncbi:MAG TPA: Calx-beta domain-containing protein, partial [Pyrinomonadaceae bacterium]|nr:Calx-beta domain-containing protein [Pyrinomonadaceae bacterium]